MSILFVIPAGLPMMSIEDFLNIPMNSLSFLTQKIEENQTKCIVNNSNIKTNNIIDFWNDFQLTGLIPSTATPTTSPNYGNLNEYKYTNDNGPAVLYYTFISGDKRNEKKYVVAISRDGTIGSFTTFSVTGKTQIDIYNSLVDFKFNDGSEFENELKDDKAQIRQLTLENDQLKR